jgi:Family of unknown function (DUF6279)
MVLLAGCSAIRFAYNQAPELAYWWLDGYVDFSEQQGPAARAALVEWFAWHRTTQLGDYASLLVAAQSQLVEDASAAQVCRWFGELRQRAEVAYEQGVPALAEFVRKLRPEQVQHIERRYQKADEEFRRDFMQPTRAEQLDKSIQRVVSRAETLYGRIDDAQRALIVQAVAASPFDPQLWLAERQARQQEIVGTLRTLVAERADTARVQAALRFFAAHAARSPRQAYRSHMQHLNEYNCAFIARLHNSSSAEQRRHGADKLKGWEADLRSLAAQRP